MSESEILDGRVEYVDVGLPFTPSLEQAYDTQPTYRLIIDVSESSALGFLELGYYIKLNYGVYFIRKKIISVFTNSQTERVLQYLKKTQKEFTVDVLNDKTVSGHQHVEFYDVSFNSGIYSVRDFQVFKGLWQEIEFELYENTYSPSIVRFTGERLIWYTKLMPQHSLTFSDVGKIRLDYVTSQGHLEVYKLHTEGQFTLPSYLYSVKQSLMFFNHEIKGGLDVIRLGSERRIIAIGKETQIISQDHDPITLQAGQYLLWHPRPQQQNKVD